VNGENYISMSITTRVSSSCSNGRVIKQTRMRWTEHVPGTQEAKSSFQKLMKRDSLYIGHVNWGFHSDERWSRGLGYGHCVR